MRSLLFFCLFLFVFNAITAQNLVPNSSFEEYSYLPTRWTGTFSKFNRWIKYWGSPTQGSPDILSIKTKDKMFPARPGFDLHPHFPRSGDIMLGIKTYGCASSTLHCKEYLQVMLKEALIPGDEYKVEFYVNPMQASILVNNIGVSFAVNKVKRIYDEGLYTMAPVVNESDLIKASPSQWIKIAGTFTADSAYQFLLIGNFIEDENTIADTSNAKIEYSFLFIDDISLENITQAQIPLVDQEMREGTVIELKNIFFDFNEATLLEASFPTLNQLVSILKSRATMSIKLAGHTDSIGTASANLELSKQRSKAVFSYLTEHGIEAERLQYEGYGETAPVADNTTEEGRQKNRRVELVVLSE